MKYDYDCQFFIDSIPHPVVITTVERRFAGLNSAFLKMFGYEPSEVLGLSARIIHANKADIHKVGIRKNEVWVEPDCGSFELEYLHKNGTLIRAETYRETIKDNQGNLAGYLDVIRDVSEGSIDRDDIRDIKEILLRNGSLPEKLKLSPAGDLINLFSSIIHIIKNLKSSWENGLYHRNKLHILHRIESSLGAAINQSRQESGIQYGGESIKIVQTAHLLHESTSFVSREKRFLAAFLVEEGIWPLEVHVDQVILAIQNVIMNAVESMPMDSVVLIRAENVHLREKTGLPLPGGRYVRLEITDRGCGIPEKNLQKIFDSKFSTKGEYRGSGLSMANSIIKKHKGYLNVESQVGAGTTITIYLPMVREKKETAAPRDSDNFCIRYPHSRKYTFKAVPNPYQWAELDKIKKPSRERVFFRITK